MPPLLIWGVPVVLVRDDSQVRRKSLVLTVDDCEGSVWAFERTSHAMRSLSKELDIRGRWLLRIPWRVSEADSPEQAAECSLQLINASNADLDPLSLHYKEDLLGDLQAAAVSHIHHRTPLIEKTHRILTIVGICVESNGGFVQAFLIDFQSFQCW